jgi:hypothetical protein
LETILGPVPYRYEKKFKGKIIYKKKFMDCEVVMHVRPRNSGLEYDWSKMQSDLLGENILKVSKNYKNLYFCRSEDIFNFFKKKLLKDIFYMLCKESKKKFFNITKASKKKFL